MTAKRKHNALNTMCIWIFVCIHYIVSLTSSWSFILSMMYVYFDMACLRNCHFALSMVHTILLNISISSKSKTGGDFKMDQHKQSVFSLFAKSFFLSGALSRIARYILMWFRTNMNLRNKFTAIVKLK